MATHGYLLPVRGVVPEGGGPAGQATGMADIVRLARAAEALGFDDLWVTDSFSRASFGKIPAR